jgi:predicted HicB family RNase H-like nuclease
MMKPKKAKMGRPPLPKGQVKGVKLVIRLTPAFHRAMCAAAKRSGTSLTGYVRGAVEEKLSREQ